MTGLSPLPPCQFDWRTPFTSSVLLSVPSPHLHSAAGAVCERFYRLRVSGRRRRPILRASHRPPLKPSVRISRTGLSQKYAIRAAHGSVRYGQTYAPIEELQPACFLRHWLLGFSQKEVSTSVSLLTYLLLPLNYLCPPPSPVHITAFMRSRRVIGASSTTRRSDYSLGIASHFAPRL